MLAKALGRTAKQLAIPAALAVGSAAVDVGLLDGRLYGVAVAVVQALGVRP